MALIKEQVKAPEKIQLSREEIANLSDAQFKTLVIKTPQNWLNLFENWMKNGVDQKEERNIQPEKNMKKQEFGKMRRGLGTSRTS